MTIKITRDSRERMEKYGLKEGHVTNCLKKPGLIIKGNNGRKIAQKRLNASAIDCFATRLMQ